MMPDNFAIQLMPSLINELIQAAELDGIEINQYVNVAVAEKLATRKTAKVFFAERAKQASAERALDILNQAGSDTEIESDYQDLLIFKP